MTFDVILYDKYYDVPLRGLLKGGAMTIAFEAQVLEGEPADTEACPGIYSLVRAFSCDEILKRVLEEKDDVFRVWRSEFDRGDVDTANHPLYVDQRYQELSARADDLFGNLSRLGEATGYMRADSGRFIFESVSGDLGGTGSAPPDRPAPVSGQA